MVCTPLLRLLCGAGVPCPELAGCVLSQFVLIFLMKTDGIVLVHDCASACDVTKNGFVKVIFEEMHTSNGISTILFVNDSFQIDHRRCIKRVHGHDITLNVSLCAQV